MKMKTKVLLALAVILLGASALAQQAAAAGTPPDGAAGASSGGTTDKGLIAIGMGLAVGLGAIGTGVAQARIGAAGLASAVEKRESLGLALIFFLLPETLVIFGLVIAFILLGKL